MWMEPEWLIAPPAAIGGGKEKPLPPPFDLTYSRLPPRDHLLSPALSASPINQAQAGRRLLPPCYTYRREVGTARQTVTYSLTHSPAGAPLQEQIRLREDDDTALGDPPVRSPH